MYSVTFTFSFCCLVLLLLSRQECLANRAVPIISQLPCCLLRPSRACLGMQSAFVFDMAATVACILLYFCHAIACCFSCQGA